jgi:predicted ribosomally synthesized peptide with SipW-like signal peptide
MKKILISLSIIGVVGALVIGGTIAYFHDEERVAGVRFEAGYINLQLRDNYPGNWGDGARYTWSVNRWIPGATTAEVLHLRNIGNINAARLTIDTHIIEVRTRADRAADAGVPDKIDMDARIIVTRMIYGGTNLLATTTEDATIFANSSIEAIDENNNQVITLRELNVRNLNLPGIPAGQEKTLDIQFTFDSTAGSGYQGDSVSAEFIIRLYQI